MTSYVLAFRAEPDRQPAANEEEAWSAWFTGMGSAIIDFGHRVGQARTVHAEGSRGDGTRVLTGYIVVRAASLDAAADLARGCPGLRNGVDVEVGEETGA